jgi:hypothetical protein
MVIYVGLCALHRNMDITNSYEQDQKIATTKEMCGTYPLVGNPVAGCTGKT